MHRRARRSRTDFGFHFLIAIAVLLVSTGPVLGQEQTGQIQGVIKDSSGGVLPGATVEAKNLALGTVTPTTTDSKGAFRFPSLKPGKYEISARMEGLAPAKTPPVDLLLGQIKQVELALSVGAATAEIKVTGEAPLIDVKQSGSSVSLRDELIEKLPRGRNFDSVLTLAPGASDEDKAGGISIDGASGAENRYIIDGQDTTNLQTGVSGKQLITDFIDEVQVKSSGFGAEYGGATGGVVNIITKSGGEILSGDLGIYYSARWLEGKVRPNLRINPETDSDAEYVTYPKDDFDQIEPAFALGGMLIKERLWYFGGYVPRLYDGLRTATFSSTGQTDDFRKNEKTHFATGNVTTQLSSTVRGRVGMSLSTYKRDGDWPAQDGTSNPAFNFHGLDRKDPNLSVSGNLDWNPTNSMYFSFRSGYFSKDRTDFGVPNQVWNTISGNMRAFPEIPSSLIRNSGFNEIPSNSASTFDKQSRLSFAFDGTFFGSLAGDHALKAGISFDRIGNNVESGYQQPRVNYRYNQSLTTLDGRVVRGQYGYTRVFSITTTGDIASNNTGLFIQDQWTVNRHLTLNLGVRTENEKVPSYRTDLGQAENAIDFSFADKFAPRLGFAYDVKGDGAWKAYGTYGVYYDITKLEMPRGSFGGDKWLDYRFSLDNYDWTNYYTPGCPPACPGTFYEVVDFRHPSNDPNDPTIDPDLKPMKSQEFTLGMQHELRRGTSLGLRYVHKQLDKTIEDVGIIVPGVGEVFYIANPGFGVAKYTIGPEFPAQPPAKRDYNGVELEFTRRMTNRWSMHASYLWSKLEGNYSGLASSDEIDVNGAGRTSPNVNRFFDSIVMSFDGNGQPVYGALGTDRTHQFKAQAIYEFPFGTTVSGNIYMASGVPISRTADMQSTTPVLYLGRVSDGRTPFLSQFDLYAQHDIRFEGGRSLAFSVNILNLFDQDTEINQFAAFTRDVLPISDEDFFAGRAPEILAQCLAPGGCDGDVDTEDQLRTDPRFLQGNDFQNRRAVRFGMKYTF